MISVDDFKALHTRAIHVGKRLGEKNEGYCKTTKIIFNSYLLKSISNLCSLYFAFTPVSLVMISILIYRILKLCNTNDIDKEINVSNTTIPTLTTYCKK